MSTVTVSGGARPWRWTAGGLNTAFQYWFTPGTEPGGNAPEVVSGLAAGDRVTLLYLSGTAQTDGSHPTVDANGDPAFSLAAHPDVPLVYRLNGGNNYLMRLVACFTDGTGQIVSAAVYNVGDGPLTLTVPAGATQMQLGVNDVIFTDNSGSWDIKVTVASGVTGQIYPPGGILLVGDLGGDNQTPKVIGLQGHSVSNTAPSDGDLLAYDATASEWVATAPTAGGSTLDIDKAGTLIGTRPALNIIDGAGIVTTVTDNGGSNRVDLTIAFNGSVPGAGDNAPLLHGGDDPPASANGMDDEFQTGSLNGGFAWRNQGAAAGSFPSAPRLSYYEITPRTGDSRWAVLAQAAPSAQDFDIALSCSLNTKVKDANLNDALCGLVVEMSDGSVEALAVWFVGNLRWEQWTSYSAFGTSRTSTGVGYMNNARLRFTWENTARKIRAWVSYDGIGWMQYGSAVTMGVGIAPAYVGLGIRHGNFTSPAGISAYFDWFRRLA